MNLKTAARRYPGQGMVEFALVLPLLLFVVMGVFDFGRAVFVYSQGSNALRDAARYAELWSPSGDQPYLQCDPGETLQNLSQRVAFASVTTTITYRKQNGTILTCAQAKAAEGTANGLTRGDMLVMTSVGSFSPMTPLISNAIPTMAFEFRAQRTIVTDLSLTPGTGSGSAGVTVGVTADNTTAPEGTSTTFTFALSSQSTETVTVNYTVAGTATQGSDYTGISTSGTISFAPGEVIKTITVAIVDDALPEGDENFGVTLSNPNNAALDPLATTATILIPANDQPAAQVSVSVNPASVSEGSSTTVTFTLSTQSATAVTANYTVGGTATAGSDYSGITSGSVTFAANETLKTINVSITDDPTEEPEETIIITITGVTSPVTIGTSTATITIPANDTPNPQVSVSVNNTNVSEGGSVTFTFALSAQTNQQVTASYTVTGTATSGSDYSGISSPGTVVFQPNETSKTVIVSIINDPIPEPAETIVVTITNVSSNATIGANNTRTVTIAASDPPNVNVAVNHITRNEGESATLTVSLSVASTQQITVNYVFTGTATFNTDYTVDPALSSSGTITFEAGQQTKTYTIAITDDTIPENAETIIFTLSGPTNANLGTSAQTITIAASDIPLVTIDALSVAENVGNALVTVRIAPTTNQAITIQYNTGDGTAKSGSDFTGTSGSTVTIAANQSTATISIPIINDTLDEDAETFYVNLVSVTSGIASIADSQAIVTIQADASDTPPVVSIADITVQENAGIARFTVAMSKASGKTVTVHYATADGSVLPNNGIANAGSDYTALSGSLTFAPGDTSNKFVDVSIIYDSVTETDENFVLNVTTQNATPASLQARATIQNVASATGPFAIRIVGPTTIARPSSQQVQLLLEISSNRQVSGGNVGFNLNVQQGSGNAISGQDFVPVHNQGFSIANGNTSTVVPITILVNNQASGNRTFTATITNQWQSGSTGAVAGTPTQVTITITP